jgi:hypothetical protein
MWVKRELAFALNQNRFEDRIVPIIYQQSDYQRLSWALSLIQMVDFSQNHAQGYFDLLRIWGLGYTP